MRATPPWQTLALASLLSLATPLALPQSLEGQKAFKLEPSSLPEQPSAEDDSSFRIPTRYESTVLARRLLSLSATAVLSTVFPEDGNSGRHVPSAVGGIPFGAIDYIADCEAFGDPTLLGLNIATTFKNAAPEAEGRVNNISLSIDWWTRYRDLRRGQPVSSSDAVNNANKDPDLGPTFDLGLYSPASLPRLTLIGALEPISTHSLLTSRIPACFKSAHPDAAWWEPGNPVAAHKGRWLRLRVHEAYWIGGFGDRAYIGWLDKAEWKYVSRSEIKGARLPGEK